MGATRKNLNTWVTRMVPVRQAGEKQLERKAKAVFQTKRCPGILWVAQDPVLRYEARDGVILDTRIVYL